MTHRTALNKSVCTYELLRLNAGTNRKGHTKSHAVNPFSHALSQAYPSKIDLDTDRDAASVKHALNLAGVP